MNTQKREYDTQAVLDALKTEKINFKDTTNISLMLRWRQEVKSFEESNEYNNVRFTIVYHFASFTGQPLHFYFKNINDVFLFCEKNLKDYGFKINTPELLNDFTDEEKTEGKSLNIYIACGIAMLYYNPEQIIN